MLFAAVATAEDRNEVQRLAARVDALSISDQSLYLPAHEKLHRRIAVAMEARADRGGSLAELATHWIEAVDAEVYTALRYSTLAGDEALGKLAPDEARRW